MVTELPLWSEMALVAASFTGSLLSAALGVGGGSLLMMVMANVLPPLALVPVHGAVQMGSNVGRAWLTRNHRQNTIVGWFACGAAVATLLALWLLHNNSQVIDADLIPLAAALFILYLSWGPIPQIGLAASRAGLIAGGLITTLASMLVGATGPLVSAWLGRHGQTKWQYTANFSHCMSIQHLLKLAVFTGLGFYFLPWLGLIGVMIGAGFIGTKVGLKLLHKLPEALFKSLFRWLLTLLALRVLYNGLLS